MAAIPLETRRRIKAELLAGAKAESNGAGSGRIPRVVRANEVPPEKIEWLWPGRLALGKISLLEGDPGLGKSTLTLEIAARLSTGRPLPGGRILPPTGSLFLSAEDGVADTIVPRLMACGADLSRILILQGINTSEGEEGVQIPRDLDVIETLMTSEACSFVVVDPLAVFLGDDISENRNQEVRKALAPAQAMFERARVSGLLLRHLTKSQSANPVYRGAGSIGLGGAARVVMMVAEDPEIPGLRVLANVKENLSKPTPSLSYRLVENEINPDVGQIQWTGETHWSAKDLQTGVDQEEGDALKDAKEWLRDYLHGGIRAQAKQVYRDAKADGHAERTIDRAKKSLKIRSEKGQDGWAWIMPDQGRQPDDQECQVKDANDSRTRTNLGALGTLEENNVNTTKSSSFSSGTLDGTLPRVPGTLAKDAKDVKDARVYEKAPWEES